MSRVATVRGPLDPARLGATLMHEHIFGLSPEIHWNWPDLPEAWDEDRRVTEAVAQLDAVHALGVDTIVDLTVIGLGRYVPAVQRVAERTAVNIVVATGIYTYDKLPPYFANRGPGSLFGGPDRMAEFFVRDIVEGIGRTGVRAGMLKCAVDHPGSRRTSPGCWMQSRRRTTRPACRSPCTRTRLSSAGWMLSRNSRAGASRWTGSSSGMPGTRPTSTTSRAWPMPARGSVWTGSASRCAVSMSGSPLSPGCANAVTPSGWCSRTTRTASTTVSIPSWWPSGTRTTTTGTSARTCSPSCDDAGWPRRRSAAMMVGNPAAILTAG